MKTRGKGGMLVLFDWIPGTARVKGLNLWRLVCRPAARFVYVKRSIEICGDKRLVIANCCEFARQVLISLRTGLIGFAARPARNILLYSVYG